MRRVINFLKVDDSFYYPLSRASSRVNLGLTSEDARESSKGMWYLRVQQIFAGGVREGWKRHPFFLLS